MTTLQRESVFLRVMLLGLRLLAGSFFRSIEVVGSENVPRDRGGLLVAWHPNGLVDPCLVLSQFPCRVVFGARHGLFRWPIVGSLMKALGTVPIYRAGDLPAAQEKLRLAGNRESLSLLAGAVAEGSYAALFPEGKSHDQPSLAPIKAGAARLYYQARCLSAPDRPVPAIVPVGLYYDAKRRFRSRALVWFYPPLEIPPDLDVTPASGEPQGADKARVRALTRTIADVLEAIVLPADDWATHAALHRVRKLIRAERAKRAGEVSVRPSLEEKTLGFARVRDAYYERRASDPGQAARLRRRVEAYTAKLDALRLDDHELDANPRLFNPLLVALSLLQALLVFIALPPLLVLGFVVNAPAALAVLGGSRLLARQPKDVATVKILIGCVAVPLTWVALAVAGAVAHESVHARFPGLPDTPWLLAISLLLLAAFGGVQALTYQRLARETLRNLKVRIALSAKARPIADALRERADLFDEIMRLGRGPAARTRNDSAGIVGPSDRSDPRNAPGAA